MKPWLMALAMGRRRVQVTETFTANATWIAPATTSRIETLSGKGQDGTPASADTRSATAQVDSVQTFASGTGNSSGSIGWADFESDIGPALSAVNAGGSGSFYGVIYRGYPNSNTYTITLNQGVYKDAIPGTAKAVRAAGWKTSGPVQLGDYGFAYIEYTERYTIPGTTGANATAFGKTFAGGVGGPASTGVHSNVAVTPLQSYSIVVPPGGQVTITYFK